MLHHHWLEILVVCALLILFRIVFIQEYKPFKKWLEITRVHQQLTELVNALQKYTIDHPDHSHFPPGPMLQMPGIALTPLQDPHPGFLRFLTTPVAYLESIPRDPYTSSTLKSPYDTTPIILRWVKSRYLWEDKPSSFEHDGWAAFSIGPSMQIPPEYEISALRRVPYESHNLSKFLYDPSNGLDSSGFLYYDTYGNSNNL
ncbi:MAG: hypothetical protein ACOX5R_21825 [bacterium]